MGVLKSGEWVHRAYGLLIALTLLGVLCFSSVARHSVIPIGCDNFGYARQAQLFRDRGLIGGLHTSIKDPQTQFLMNIARATIPDSDDWSQAIAPHCHHFDVRTGRVILQYPPGTGFFLSLFPEPFAMPYLLATGSVVVACLLAWLAIGRRLTVISVVALLATTACLFWVLSAEVIYWASDSIPVTLLLVPLVVALGSCFLGKSRLAALAFGILCGALITVRLPNGLIVVGLGVQGIVAARLWIRENFKENLPSIAMAALGLVFGLLPILLENRINAGGFFHTTYSSIDATAPVYTWQSIKDAVAYYFTAQLGAPTLIAAVFVLLIGAGNCSIRRDKYVPAGTIGAAVVLLVSLCFFVTHSVRIFYYMVPANLAAIFMVTMELVKRDAPTRRTWAYLTLVPMLVWGAFEVHRAPPYAVATTLPVEAMDTQSVVWADSTNGTIYYYTGRMASKLVLADLSTQDALVEAVRAAGRKQYFVVDTADFMKICNRQAARFGATYVGEAEAFGSRQVWKIDPVQPGPQRRCEHSK